MFKTNRNAELFPRLSHSADGVQFWSFIEQDMACPWFYLQIVEEDDKEAFRSMLMVPTPALLEQIVAAVNDHAWLEQAQLVTPGHINKTGRWLMESLLEVAAIRNEQGQELGYEYLVEGGRTYSISADQLPEGQLNIHTIFSAALHLPN